MSISANDPKILETSDGRTIAYHRHVAQPGSAGAKQPGVMFLPGFKSDMEGSKALHVHEWAERKGRTFLRFDYTGHGQSSGAFEDGCIGDWFRDACDVLMHLTEGPQILVGSSMGGWISMLIMQAMPERLAGFVGIAAAPDFTEESMWRRATAQQRTALRRDGAVSVPSDYSEEPYIITRKLIEEGRDHLVLRKPLRAPCPVRLLQGMEDEAVPFETAARLVRHIEGDDVRAILLNGADHRLSGERELALLLETLEEIPWPMT